VLEVSQISDEKDYFRDYDSITNLKDDMHLLFFSLTIFFLATANLSAQPLITTSNNLPKSNDISYTGKNLNDIKTSTAWCANVDDNSKIFFSIKYDKLKALAGIAVISGYAKSDKAYHSNARPKNMTLFVDGKLAEQLTLKDTPTLQKIIFGRRKGKEFRFVIDEVYPGEVYNNVCLTEVFTDPRVVDATAILESIEQRFDGRALTLGEIKREFAPFFEKYYHADRTPVDYGVFYDALYLQTENHFKMRNLRLLLDLAHYSNCILRVTDAELLEGLRDSIIPFIEQQPRMTLFVAKDPKQVERGMIISAFSQFEEFRSYDASRKKPLTRAQRSLGAYLDAHPDLPTEDCR
jgi:hypothetical protein